MRDSQLLDLLREIERPFITSKDVVDAFNVETITARRRLDSLEKLESHKPGQAKVWYWNDWEDRVTHVSPRTDGPQT